MSREAEIRLNGARLLADLSGALFWPERSLLAVSDMHLEKGSSYARRGQFLPPYDTRTTLAALEATLLRYRPRHVICLGDSLHDASAVTRLNREDRSKLQGLVRAHKWTWICGNHDPQIPDEIEGERCAQFVAGPLLFRHEAASVFSAGEVSGHYHPKASVSWRGQRLSGRCFLLDGRRLVLPAFGAYAGGLDAGDTAIKRLFPNGCQALILGRARIARLDLSILRNW